MTKRCGAAIVIIAIAALWLPALAAEVAPGPEAQVRPYMGAGVEARSYPVFDASGQPLGTAPWRVVTKTGNCCENYIATTNAGRILDFGGDTLYFSDDKGDTWKGVHSLHVLLGAEGAVVGAPGGDIVGATWDPYSGDQVVTFKYEAASDNWYYSQQLLHTPFFDRPWIAVIEGPFRIGAVEVPWISVLTSNLTEDTVYYSVDGLNYVLLSNKVAEQAATASKSRWLELPADAETDRIQPITEMELVPLAGGGALTRPGLLRWADWAIVEPPNLRLAPFAFPQDEHAAGRMLTDSRGRLHYVATESGHASFTYLVSSDGGRSWASTDVALPTSHVVEDWDFKTDARLGLTVVGVHAHDKVKKVDQDLVYAFSSGGAPQLTRAYFVGDGDLNVGSGFGAAIRFDFSTIGILPDGSVVTTFMDSLHKEPSLAILLEALPTSSKKPKPGTPQPTPPNPEPSPSPSPSPSPTTVEDETPPKISGVRDSPDPFTPNGDGKRDQTNIRFRIDENATVSVVVKRTGKVVRKLMVRQPRVAGSWATAWDGRDNRGRVVKAGRYVYVIRAEDVARNSSQARGTVTVKR